MDVTVYPNGIVRGGHDYIHFRPGDSTACMDGHFTAEKLAAMAKYMEGVRKFIEANPADSMDTATEVMERDQKFAQFMREWNARSAG